MMERFTVTMNESDIDFFESERNKLGMSKSAFIRLLIAEHKKEVPTFIRYKEIIKQLSDINSALNEIIINENISSTEKMIIFENIKKVNDSIKKYF